MKGFFHRVRKLGRLVGRFMSPVEDENSKGVNTSGWTTIRALHDQAVVLRAQGEGGEQGVIGVLYLSMLVRSTAHRVAWQSQAVARARRAAARR